MDYCQTLQQLLFLYYITHFIVFSILFDDIGFRITGILVINRTGVDLLDEL